MEKYEGKPFVLLGVNSDEDRDHARQVVAAKGLNWRSWWAGEKGTGGAIPTGWQIEGWPSMFLIDPDGTVRAKVDPSDLRSGKLERDIDRLLIEMKFAKK